VKQYIQYANDVLNGKIKVGKLMYLACQRFKSDLQRPDLLFDEAKVDRAIAFIKLLSHFEGKSSQKPFILEFW